MLYHTKHMTSYTRNSTNLLEIHFTSASWLPPRCDVDVYDIGKVRVCGFVCMLSSKQNLRGKYLAKRETISSPSKLSSLPINIEPPPPLRPKNVQSPKTKRRHGIKTCQAKIIPTGNASLNRPEYKTDFDQLVH